MVAGLGGIEQFILTVNPETKKLDTYECVGYYNTGRFVPVEGKPDRLIPGKLVNWYRPLSGKGNPHSAEFLELMQKTTGCEYQIILLGQQSYL